MKESKVQNAKLSLSFSLFVGQYRVGDVGIGPYGIAVC